MINLRACFTVAALLVACERIPPASTRSDSSVALTGGKGAFDSAGSETAAAHGTFAFVNADSTQLLALDSLRNPSTLHGALCSGGISLVVRYDHRATAQPSDNGRQVAANFANQQGEVFNVIGNKATPDQTCFLSADSLLLARARAVSMRKPAECSNEEVSRVGDAKHRQVIHCWDIATAPGNLEVLAVQFVDVDSAALASLVVFGDGSLFFKDFPAVHHAGDESTWRVDDEGIFAPTGFDVLFVADLPRGFVMAITWAGAEGEDSELMRADSAGNLRTLVKAYRYWSPT